MLPGAKGLSLNPLLILPVFYFEEALKSLNIRVFLSIILNSILVFLI